MSVAIIVCKYPNNSEDLKRERWKEEVTNAFISSKIVKVLKHRNVFERKEVQGRPGVNEYVYLGDIFIAKGPSIALNLIKKIWKEELPTGKFAEAFCDMMKEP